MTDIIERALEYYDTNYEKYNKKLREIKYIKFVDSPNDMSHNSIYLYDIDKKQIHKSRYEIIGLHNSATRSWTWSWSIAAFNKNSTYIARKILIYGTELDPSNRFLKTELITSRFQIADNIQLDIHAGIASYLSKQPVVYKYKTYMADTFKMTAEGLVDMTPPDENTESYTTYYLFLLDTEGLLDK